MAVDWPSGSRTASSLLCTSDCSPATTRIRSFRHVVRVGQFNAAIAVAVGTSGAIGGETQACLWWTYFGGDDGPAEESLMAASPARRSILAIRATGMSIWRSFSASVDSRRRRGGGASPQRAVEHRAGRGTRRRRRALSERAGCLSGVSRHRQPGSAIGRCTRLPGQPCRWGQRSSQWLSSVLCWPSSCSCSPSGRTGLHHAVSLFIAD